MADRMHRWKQLQDAQQFLRSRHASRRHKPAAKQTSSQIQQQSQDPSPQMDFSFQSDQALALISFGRQLDQSQQLRHAQNFSSLRKLSADSKEFISQDFRIPASSDQAPEAKPEDAPQEQIMLPAVSERTEGPDKRRIRTSRPQAPPKPARKEVVEQGPPVRNLPRHCS